MPDKLQSRKKKFFSINLFDGKSLLCPEGRIFAQIFFSVSEETSPILVTCTYVLGNERRNICKRLFPVRPKTKKKEKKGNKKGNSKAFCVTRKGKNFDMNSMELGYIISCLSLGPNPS